MSDTGYGEVPGGLYVPARNRYYYGKPLDVGALTLEQRYGNDKRRLVNRTVLGDGVVRGLEVVATPDNQVQVAPGIALDRYGREIVVSEPSPPVDPLRVTDDCGRPTGDPLPFDRPVTIYLVYHECPAGFVDVDPCEPGCGEDNRCEAGLIQERYRILVAEDSSDTGLGLHCSTPDLWFQTEGGGYRIDYGVLAQAISRPDVPPEGDGRIPLAQVVVHEPEDDAPGVEIYGSDRDLVFNNDQLMEAMVCLARVIGGAPDLPRVVGFGPWTHAGTLGLSQFVNEGLTINFDRPMLAPDGPPQGWFRVCLEYLPSLRTVKQGGRDAARRAGGFAYQTWLWPQSVTWAEDRLSVNFLPRPFGTTDDDDTQDMPDSVLCRVALKSHVILDEQGQALDGDLLGGSLNSGNGTQGGDFESWFDLQIREGK
jgi:hypothetical protein